MDINTFMPIVVEATKFIFDEVGMWIENVRQRSKKSAPEQILRTINANAPELTRNDFLALEANPRQLEATINVRSAQADAYEMQGLVNQIKTHRKNLVDFESTEAEYGPLTPLYIKRGMEREADAIVEKSARLKSLLEQVYERRIESV
jgi:hypothetical protein